jgi:alpha-methylacyl-CoA racemase
VTTGPLRGRRVIELAGLGPAPFAAMMLGDMGADVLRIDRADAARATDTSNRTYILNRSKRSVAIDIKSVAGHDAVLRLVESADALVEGFRPGVTERLGLGPADCHARNPRLVYGRMTGWGQDGPLAPTAGHDIDYIAIAGALHAIGAADGPPVLPLNLVGDFGGGGMLLAFGVVCGILAAIAGETDQVVDAAMVDGTALLLSLFHGFMARDAWVDRRGVNRLDGGAPYYAVYETSDGGHLAVGAIEPQFFAELMRMLELDPAGLPAQNEVAGWPVLREALGRAFAARTRDEWASHFEGSDACVVPVLSLTEATRHPHNVARSTFVDVEGLVQPAPAPRFSASPVALERLPALAGEHSTEALLGWGFGEDEVDELLRSGAVVQRAE